MEPPSTPFQQASTVSALDLLYRSLVTPLHNGSIVLWGGGGETLTETSSGRLSVLGRSTKILCLKELS